MRRYFVDILKEHKLNITQEYNCLFSLIYDDREIFGGHTSFYDEVNENFMSIWFRGTAISLEDFNEKYNFYFVPQPNNFDLNYFLLFCEYWYNIAFAFFSGFHNFLSVKPLTIIEQINRIINGLEFQHVEKDGMIIFVPTNTAAIEVSEIVDENSFETLFYNHHSLKGDLKTKKDLLIKFADYLEPKRNDLKSINKSFESNLFQLFNKMHIRHNNKNTADKAHYVEYVDKMKSKTLEEWYDNIYQMYLLAVLMLEHYNKKDKLDELIDNINKI